MKTFDISNYFINSKFEIFNLSQLGGGVVVFHPLLFLLNKLKTAHIRTLKLLHFFNIIAVNKLCKKKILFDAKVRVEDIKTAGSYFKNG